MVETKDYMKRALALARQAMGSTSPNPAVGAVIVKSGEVLGEGHTLPPGRSHAEVVALTSAGEGSRDGSLYVTMEPCCIHGRTPPCTEAIIAAGIAEVHAATIDPNPRVSGAGLSKLRSSGVKVFHGEGEEDARQLYEGFAKHVNTGLPFVTAKFAMSLDGKIATHTGDSKWIAGEIARGYVQEMRKTSDAIMVGVNTVLRDDPQLTARDEDGRPLARQPLRVVLDSGARTPPDARMLKEPGHTLIAVTRPPDGRVASLMEAGAEIIRLPETRDGRVEPRALLEALGARGVVSLMVEGGGTLLGSLFHLGLVDKVVAFIAPVVIGGGDAPSPVAGKGVDCLIEATTLERVRVEPVGEDIMVVGYPVPVTASVPTHAGVPEG